MERVAPTDVVIPAAQVDAAMSDLREHIRMIHGSSTWLYCEGKHSAAAYFAILCMEEMSKHHKLGLRKREDKAVTVEDMRSAYSHRKKIFSFLCKMGGTSGTVGQCLGHKSQCSPNYSLAAAKLNFMKQLAVYHELVQGGVITLEGVLGRDNLFKVSTHLQHIACQGVAAMDEEAGIWKGTREIQEPACPGRGIDGALAKVMELACNVPTGNPLMDGVVLGRQSLDSVLKSLEWHIGELDILAVMLHNSWHHAASIFMSIMSFEEANKYHVIARCRRRGDAVSKGDIEPLLNHKTKLTVFLKDVSDYQKRQNAKAGTRPTRKYHTIDPWALWRLNSLKQISMYFTHVCGRTTTLERLLDLGAGGVSTYLRKTLLGMISWAILCDGDTDDPYTMHGTNPVHAKRLKKLVDFKTDEEYRAADGEMYYAIGLLDCLNGAIGRHDAELCEETLSIIEGI